MAALRPFVYLPMSRMGETKYGPDNGGPVGVPDFVHGPASAPRMDGGYDEFGWCVQGPVIVNGAARLTTLHGASVQRRSLGRDRWHIVMAEGVCARDSYHDGEWISAHIGETQNVLCPRPTGGTDLVPVHFMDDAPVDEHIAGEAVLVQHYWAENYAHTLLETASRFWAFEAEPRLAGLPVIWNCSRPWQREVADILAPTRFRFEESRNRLAFTTLHVPSFHSQIGCSPQSIAWLRKRFEAPDMFGKRKIFVSRADATERRVVNENEVIEALKPMGFETVMLTGMTVAEQRQLFGEAGTVVMPHGAGCANMIFCGTGTTIVEFVPRSYQHHMFQHVAKWSGHWYARLISEDGANKDMRVDVGVLKQALVASGI